MTRTAPEMSLTDAELVVRAQRGMSPAFAELVRRYQDRVYNLCYRMCRNEGDARDLTQTAFVRALEGLGGFRQNATFYTWLFRIAVNLALSQRRSAARRSVLSLDAGPDQASGYGTSIVDRSPPVSAALERAEACERVQAALGRLEPDFRAAVILKDIEELDYAAISQILSIPLGTVKSRIHRGRMMLRDLLLQERDALGQR